MPNSSFKFKGDKAMQAKLRRIAKRFPDKVLGAVRIEAELIKTDSQQNYVPVDLGTLRSSAQAEAERKGLNTVEGRITYGGAASAYALAVHEDPSQYSPPSWQGKQVTFSPEGRGAKYLERPLKKALEGMDQRIADRIRKQLEREEGGGSSGGSGGGGGRKRDSKGRFI